MINPNICRPMELFAWGYLKRPKRMKIGYLGGLYGYKSARVRASRLDLAFG